MPCAHMPPQFIIPTSCFFLTLSLSRNIPFARLSASFIVLFFSFAFADDVCLRVRLYCCFGHIWPHVNMAGFYLHASVFCDVFLKRAWRAYNIAKKCHVVCTPFSLLFCCLNRTHTHTHIRVPELALLVYVAVVINDFLDTLSIHMYILNESEIYILVVYITYKQMDVCKLDICMYKILPSG